MAINLCCPVCYKTYKLKTLICKCGKNLKHNKLFKVRIKRSDGKWKSKQVNSLELAKKVEAKFKIQSVEETVFDIHRAPIPEPATMLLLGLGLLGIAGVSESELQMITDHARLDSVRRYAKTEVARKREIMERRTQIISIKNYKLP